MTKAPSILKDKKIGIIGSGNMGRALALGMVQSGAVLPNHLMASDADERQRQTLAQAAGIQVVGSNLDLVRFADVIMLAVKPQVMNSVLEEIAASVRPEQPILSIAAGIPTTRIEKFLDRSPVVRIMPNTPALVGKGMAALCGGTRAQDRHMALAAAIMGCVGEAITVPEAWMDAVTATSGSGPAYVFYFIEALTEGAMQLGIDQATAQKLVVETFAGAIALLKGSAESPQTLRQRVTSPGGTTAAALRVLDAQQTKKILADALAAARDRGKELSRF